MSAPNTVTCGRAGTSITGLWRGSGYISVERQLKHGAGWSQRHRMEQKMHMYLTLYWYIVKYVCRQMCE